MKHIDTRQYHSSRGDAKSLTAENGHIEGYASVYNNVDLVGDVVRRGAFAKTIQERVNNGKVPLMALHWAYGGDTREVIGTVTEAKEDDYGLWIKAELSSIESAQEVRTLAQEGHVKGLSIGYNIIDADWVVENEREIFELKELRLLEVTVTTHPANELAVITNAKSLTGGTEPQPSAASSAPVVTDITSADDHAELDARMDLAKYYIDKEKIRWKS